MDVRDTDEAKCVETLMKLYQEMEGKSEVDGIEILTKSQCKIQRKSVNAQAPGTTEVSPALSIYAGFG